MQVFKFRTVESVGSIHLLDTEVESEIRSGLTRWTYRVPYADLSPHVMLIWSTPRVCWLCLVFGTLGVWGTAYDWFGIEGRHLPFWAHPIFLGFAILLFWIAFLSRREEWAVFANREGNQVRYAKNGPNEKQFSEFTAALAERIKASRARECDKLAPQKCMIQA